MGHGVCSNLSIQNCVFTVVWIGLPVYLSGFDEELQARGRCEPVARSDGARRAHAARIWSHTRWCVICGCELGAFLSATTFLIFITWHHFVPLVSVLLLQATLWLMLTCMLVVPGYGVSTNGRTIFANAAHRNKGTKGNAPLVFDVKPRVRTDAIDGVTSRASASTVRADGGVSGADV